MLAFKTLQAGARPPDNLSEVAPRRCASVRAVPPRPMR